MPRLLLIVESKPRWHCLTKQPLSSRTWHPRAIYGGGRKDLRVHQVKVIVEGYLYLTLWLNLSTFNLNRTLKANMWSGLNPDPRLLFG